MAHLDRSQAFTAGAPLRRRRALVHWGSAEFEWRPRGCRITPIRALAFETLRIGTEHKSLHVVWSGAGERL